MVHCCINVFSTLVITYEKVPNENMLIHAKLDNNSKSTYLDMVRKNNFQ